MRVRRLALLLLLAGCAAPREPAGTLRIAAPPPPAATPSAVAPARLPWMLPEPIRLVPRASERGMELAPLANRDLEAPGDSATNPFQPWLEPMLLPPERRFGVTFGREHLREDGPGRPFDNFMPGARLHIPFESAPPQR